MTRENQIRMDSVGTLVRGAARDFGSCWRQLLLAEVLARAVALTLLTPLVGLLLKLFLLTSAERVVTDQAILAFLLHPLGMLALLVMATVTVAIRFLDVGQLMIISFGRGEGRHVTWLDAFIYAYRRAAHIGGLALFAVIGLLRAALPFLAGLGLLFWLLARTHDINYYLAIRPPEFLAAAAVAALLLAGLIVRLLHRFGSWLISLPLVLFEDMGGRQALAVSRQRTTGMRALITGRLVGWLLLRIGLSVAVSFIIARVANLIVPRGGGSETLILVVISSLIILSIAANLAVSVGTTMFFPLLIVRVYRTMQEGGRLRGEIGAAGSPQQPPARQVAGKRFLAGVAITLVAGSGFAWMLLDDYQWEEPAQIIAHRGGAAVAPENTMAAFHLAMEEGADWLEVDVQENADGTVIVHHDRDFMRAARRPLTVWRTTDADLEDIDVGAWFAASFAGQRVPTLRQVLLAARERAGLFIELKYYGNNQELEAKVHRLVEETGMKDQVVIMSLDFTGLRRAMNLHADGTYGLLNAVAVGDLTRLDVDFLAVTAQACSAAMVRRAHARGMKIYAWTVNDPVQMWVMMSRGVDGIITDRVAMAMQIKELREEMTPVGRYIVWLAAESGLLDGMEPRERATEAQAAVQ